MLVDTENSLTTAEFAALVNTSTETIKKYCQNHIIAGVKVGNSWIIPKSEVARFKNERRPRGRPPKAA